MIDTSVARRLAEDLLTIGAVTFRPEKPFTWASGLQSPVYCDNRLTISYPDVRNRIREGFIDALERSGIDPDLIVGTATAGIPHAAWLADSLELPMAYVRARPKEHGKASQVEGLVVSGAHAVVIEDLISTGRSSGITVEALRYEGVIVDAVMAIFSYEMDESIEAFRQLGVSLITLTNLDELFAAARERGWVSDEMVGSLQEWLRDPVGWSRSRERGT